jgi:predicted TIM-barrel fold metal-dependent hydrolase
MAIAQESSQRVALDRDGQDRVVVVSADTHVGPLLVDQLRPYCPRRHLSAFDDYVEQDRRYREALLELAPQTFFELPNGERVRGGWNRLTDGHHDVHARLRDMNFDGVAAEVIFHGSLNDEPLPFANMGDPKSPMFFKNNPPLDPALAAIGRRIYNAWLADFCSVEPARHVGLAQIPVWDIEACTKEVESAREAGLRGINFPAPQSWLLEYSKPEWEPLWSAAEDLEMPLVTHFGAGSDADYSGPAGTAIQIYETTAIFGRRLLPWIVLSGVFERHPRLKLVITEIPGIWWSQVLAELDSVHRAMTGYTPTPATDTKTSASSSSSADVDFRLTGGFAAVCPRPPSEYCKTNVFVGASFMNAREARAAYEEGYDTNYLWGSDYPHPEGTFDYPNEWGDTPVTHLAQRFAFAEIPIDATRRMLGENAIDVYGLDRDELSAVANRINALTPAQQREPVEQPLGLSRSWAFRQHGTFD